MGMNRFLLVLVILIVSSHVVYSQEMYYKLYADAEYDKLEKRLVQAIANQPQNVLFNHVYGILYATKEYQKNDLNKAYEYLLQAKTLYPSISTSDKERFAKLGLTQSRINKDFEDVCKQLWNIAVSDNTIEACNTFINKYDKAPKEIKEQALQYRNELAFAEAKKTHTIQSYQLFIQTYPKAEQVQLAITLRDEIAFEQAMKTNTLDALRDFMNNYPQSKFYAQVNTLYSERIFSEATKNKDYKSYERFIRDNPKNPMLPLAIERMVEIAKEKQDIKMLKKTVDYSVGIHFNYALYEYFKEFSKDGEYLTLYTFVQQYPRTFLDTLLAKEFKIAEKGERLDLSKPYDTVMAKYFEDYIRLAAPKEKAFLALQKYISNDIVAKDWNTAIAKVKKFEPYFGKNNKKISDLLQILSAQYDNNIIVRPIPGQVNTPTGGEYAPIITADNKYLYFCGSKRADNIGNEDIFISENEQGEWGKPRLLKELSTPQYNEAVISISNDGTQMIYFREGIIYYSEKSFGGWSQGVSVSDYINSGEWTGDAWITGDGNAIIFAAVRSEGMNYYTERNANLGVYHGAVHHQSDLYVSVKHPNGSWGKPKSLGPTINTIYTERSPFLYHDTKTLYFSSDGHGGLGNLDVYKSTRLSDTCWDCWSTPVNLGKEINTPEENWGYRISPDGKHFYFAARKTGEKFNDIMYVSIPSKFLPEHVVCLTGTLVDAKKKPIQATIVYEDLALGTIVGEAKTDPIDGSYFIALPNGKIYGYYIKHDSYYPESHFVDVTKNKESRTVREDITAISFDQMKQDKVAVRLNNLFFDTNKSNLLPYSIPELQRAAKIIQKYQLRVEISGHTDNVGEDDFNMDLSLRRAQAVKDFLVKEGCNPNLFEVKGYGETKPAQTNETLEGRAKNRRVELRFL